MLVILWRWLWLLSVGRRRRGKLRVIRGRRRWVLGRRRRWWYVTLLWLRNLEVLENKV